MKIEVTNRYVCDYCRKSYLNKQYAEECEMRCKERLEWEKHTSPKFKIGDVVEVKGMRDWVFIIKFMKKHSIKNTWVYLGNSWYTNELKITDTEIEDDEYLHTLLNDKEENLHLIYTAQEFEEIRKRISDKLKVADIGVTTDGGFGVVVKLEEV